jgi:CubicO group peptidase (beta-lactamase class C family)
MPMNLTLKDFVFATGLAMSAFGTVVVHAGEGGSADDRLPILKNFFNKYRSPLALHADDFLKTADRFGLDWRLLPSLVIIESGGRNIRNNNVFGWGNGASRFRSVADSIAVVAECLTNKLPYRGKSFEEKMQAYNPRRRNYAGFVQKMMDQIAPESGLAAVAPAASGN